MCFDGFNHAHNFIKALNGSLCFLYLLMAITLYCIIVKRAIFKCVNCTDFFVLCDWYSDFNNISDNVSNNIKHFSKIEVITKHN